MTHDMGEFEAQFMGNYPTPVALNKMKLNAICLMLWHFGDNVYGEETLTMSGETRGMMYVLEDIIGPRDNGDKTAAALSMLRRNKERLETWLEEHDASF